MSTLADIAAIAGTSISTVSRALKNDPRISKETIRKIQSIAADTGYAKAGSKSGQAGCFPKTVTLIIPEVLSGYYARIVHLTQKNLLARKYSLSVRITNFDTAVLIRHLKELRSERISGLLIVLDDAEKLSDDVLSLITALSCPVMFITSRYISNLDFDNIYLDEQRGISMAIDHLNARGCKTIGFLGEQNTLGRLEYFQNTMRSHGFSLNEDHIVLTSLRAESGGYQCIQKLLSRNCTLPDALFASYDQMAVGAICALLEAGIRVPEDIALLGFDDLPISKFVYKGITSIQNPCEDMISVSCRILLNRINGDHSTPQQIALKPSLVIRGTA